MKWVNIWIDNPPEIDGYVFYLEQISHSSFINNKTKSNYHTKKISCKVKLIKKIGHFPTKPYKAILQKTYLLNSYFIKSITGDHKLSEKYRKLILQ